MTMPRRGPRYGAGVGWIAAVAVLALPLAGCVSQVPPAAPGPAAPAAWAALPPPLSTAARHADNGTLPCPLLEERREEQRVREAIVVVQGCLAAAEPLLEVTVPDEADLGFDVHGGAQHLLVLFQLRGPEALRAVLRGPWPEERTDGADEGDADRDSMARFELAEPPAGAWRLRAWTEDLAVARGWVATVVVTYS